MKKYSLFFCFIFLISVIDLQASWTQMPGPYGESILDIAIDSGGKIYLAGHKALYISTDNGNLWEPTSFNSQVSSISLLNDSTIYLGTWDGIFRSTDCGNTFEQKLILTGGTSYISDIAFINDTIIATVSDYMYTGGFYKSIDNGETWDFIEVISTYSLLVIQDETIFAGRSGGVLKSSDFGNTWTGIHSCPGRVETLVINSEGTIFCGSNNHSGYGNLCYSKDNGDTWITTALINKDINDIVFDQENNILACCETGEVFRSDDEGSTWEEIFNTSAPNRAMACNSGFDLFVGSSNDFGVYRKLFGIENWENVNIGLANVHINTIKQFSTGEIIVGTAAGTFLSSDECDTWTQINQGLKKPEISCMTITANDDVFVGTTATGGGCIYKKHAEDNYWVQSHPPKTSFYTLLVDQSGIIYTGMMAFGIIKSTDNGDTWVVADNGIVHNYVYTLELDSTGRLYAGTHGGIYYSDDQGENWSMYGLEGKGVSLIKILGNNIYAAASGGLYRSSFDGSWEVINNGLENFTILAMEMDPENTLYISTYGLKIYYSENFGNNWIELENEINSTVYSIKYIDSSVYFGTHSHGIFKYQKDYTNIYNRKYNAPTIEVYPNPINGQNTTIEYAIEEAGWVELSVFTLGGKKVKTLVNQYQSVASYSKKLMTQNLEAGIYVISLKLDGIVANQFKLIVL